MLGYLEGKILSKNEDGRQCVVLCQSVGYELTLAASHFDALQTGAQGVFHVHTHVREDQLTLFGFATESEKQFFRVLIGVSGLGPKTALALLSAHGADRLVRLVANKEIEGIAEAPGVGKKLAQRVVLELQGKLEKLAWTTGALLRAPESAASSPAVTTLRDDLDSALQHLGYSPQLVQRTLDKLDLDESGFEVSLKEALKQLSGRVHG